jgi:hypothetical protein
VCRCALPRAWNAPRGVLDYHGPADAPWHGGAGQAAPSRAQGGPAACPALAEAVELLCPRQLAQRRAAAAAAGSRRPCFGSGAAGARGDEQLERDASDARGPSSARGGASSGLGVRVRRFAARVGRMAAAFLCGLPPLEAAVPAALFALYGVTVAAVAVRSVAEARDALAQRRAGARSGHAAVLAG